MGVNALQQDHALELNEIAIAHLRYLGGESSVGLCGHGLQQIFIGDGAGGADLLLQGEGQLPLLGQYFFQASDVPLFLHRLKRHILTHQVGKAAFAQRSDLGRQVRRIQNFIALLVNDLALIIRDIVILKQLLSHIEVARLNLALRALNTAGDDASLDGLAIRHLEPVHDAFDAVAGKNPHQGVVQAQVETR